MFDKEKFNPEFYDKLSDSEKQEFVRCMLEEQLTDPLHIKGLPKPVQNSIKSAAKHCAKNMKEETIAGYPVEWINGIKSKDEKMMRRESDEFPTPPKPVTMVQLYDAIHMHWNKPDLSKHDAMMYSDSFVPVNRSPRWVEKYLETKRWIDGIRDPEIDILTGCTQNFKLQTDIDLIDKKMKEIPDEFMGKLLRDLRENSPCRMIPISDRAKIFPPDLDEMGESVRRISIHTYDWAIAPSHRADHMGRIWLDSIPKLCEHMGISKEEYLTWLYDSAKKHGYQPNTLYIRPRAFGHNYKSSLWMKLLGMEAQSYSIDEFPMLPEPITTVQLYDVIHWNHAHINYTFGLKAKDCRARHALEELVGYNDLSPISRMIFDSLKVNGPEMLKRGKLVGPNFNEDKNALERVIKKGGKRK